MRKFASIRWASTSCSKEEPSEMPPSPCQLGSGAVGAARKKLAGATSFHELSFIVLSIFMFSYSSLRQIKMTGQSELSNIECPSASLMGIKLLRVHICALQGRPREVIRDFSREVKIIRRFASKKITTYSK